MVLKTRIDSVYNNLYITGGVAIALT